jgi:hypothetical protein
MNNTLASSTFKSAFLSVGLHALILVLGSWAIYKTPMASLELTGSGSSRKKISLSGFNFVSKNRVSTQAPREKDLPISSAAIFSNSKAIANNQEVGSGNSKIASSGSGAGNSAGNGHDRDDGELFLKIKNFFESRLGDTLNIREEQLIKIRVTLNAEGEILNAELVQGKLEFQMLKRVLNVAKTIPLKNFWKTQSVYPEELIIPLVLTPS